MTVNRPNHQFTIKIDETGFGKIVVKGVHWLEVEMMRVVNAASNEIHHVFAQPHSVDNAESANHAEICVYGKPGGEGAVEFHAASDNVVEEGTEEVTKPKTKAKKPTSDAATPVPAQFEAVLTADNEGNATYVIEPTIIPNRVVIVSQTNGTATVSENTDGGACIWLQGAKVGEQVTVVYTVADSEE